MARRRRRRSFHGFAGTSEEHGARADQLYKWVIKDSQKVQSESKSGQCARALVAFSETAIHFGQAEENRRYGMVDADLHDQAKISFAKAESDYVDHCLLRKGIR